jgi:hypothetical protein
MTNRWMRNMLYTTLSLTLLFALSFPAAAAAVEQTDERGLIDIKELELLAKEAKTPAEHAAVAKHYRLRAEAFETKAVKHEEEAAKLAKRPRHPLESKWPAMVRNAADRERKLAMQARRAAKECFDLADQHIRLAVEAELAE